MNKYRLEITLVDENNRAVDHYTLLQTFEDLATDVYNRNFNEIIQSMIETEQYNKDGIGKMKTPIADSIMKWVMAPADIGEPKLKESKGEDIF